MSPARSKTHVLVFLLVLSPLSAGSSTKPPFPQCTTEVSTVLRPHRFNKNFARTEEAYPPGLGPPLKIPHYRIPMGIKNPVVEELILEAGRTAALGIARDIGEALGMTLKQVCRSLGHLDLSVVSIDDAYEGNQLKKVAAVIRFRARVRYYDENVIPAYGSANPNVVPEFFEREYWVDVARGTPDERTYTVKAVTHESISEVLGPHP